MSELEAYSWLSHHYGYSLVKSGDSYMLSVVGFGDAIYGDSVLDCVIRLKGRIGE